jgi:hypothetical protein
MRLSAKASIRIKAKNFGLRILMVRIFPKGGLGNQLYTYAAKRAWLKTWIVISESTPAGFLANHSDSWNWILWASGSNNAR